MSSDVSFVLIDSRVSDKNRAFTFVYDPIKIWLGQIPCYKVLFLFFWLVPEKKPKNKYLNLSTIEMLEEQRNTCVKCYAAHVLS